MNGQARLYPPFVAMEIIVVRRARDFLIAPGATLKCVARSRFISYGSLRERSYSRFTTRILEFSVLRKIHPLLSARLAAMMHPVGVVLLLTFGIPVATVFGVLHGAGNGILTSAKGTLHA